MDHILKVLNRELESKELAYNYLSKRNAELTEEVTQLRGENLRLINDNEKLKEYIKELEKVIEFCRFTKEDTDAPKNDAEEAQAAC
jgi:cell division protein FtsB